MSTVAGWAKPQTAVARGEETAAERAEFLYGELREVSCARCATTVLATKRSPIHTSIQWRDRPELVCPVFAEHPDPHRAEGCPWLHDSIAEAAAAGVFDEHPSEVTA